MGSAPRRFGATTICGISDTRCQRHGSCICLQFRFTDRAATPELSQEWQLKQTSQQIRRNNSVPRRSQVTALAECLRQRTGNLPTCTLFLSRPAFSAFLTVVSTVINQTQTLGALNGVNSDCGR
jgi:hypothetical protein